jgi:hypothetical protein
LSQAYNSWGNKEIDRREDENMSSSTPSKRKNLTYLTYIYITYIYNIKKNYFVSGRSEMNKEIEF